MKHLKSLKVIPLGGVGEFGMNMMLFEYEHHVVIVDVGLMFPDDDLPGVDVVIPDFSYLRHASRKVHGIFLTHGHLDHIGGVPYLLREMNVPVYGMPMTLGFLGDRLKEHRQALRQAVVVDDEMETPTLQLIPIQPDVPVTLGPFSIEAIPVTHSIADSVAYAIRTPVGCVIHTGDFKIDPTPVRGAGFDATRFIEYGQEGVLALFSDSTNSERTGHCGSERVIGETLDRLIPEMEGRVLIATFSSHLHRMDQIAQIAARHGRKLFLSGKSLSDALRIGRETGYEALSPNQVLPLQALSQTPDREVLIITTGSQGEPTSALFKAAMDDHKQLNLKQGDTVILSARVIPGNEGNVTRMINQILRRGARVVQERGVHVSGHAHRDEQKQMIEWVRPRYFIPVHGDYRQLLGHAEVAAQTGLPAEQIRVIENGATLLFTPDGCELGKPVPAARVYIDGKEGIEAPTLADRRYLASEGMLVVTLSISKMQLRAGPTFLSRGFVPNDPELPLWKEMASVIEQLFAAMEAQQTPEDPTPDSEVISTQVKKTLKKWISKKMHRYPLILPNIRVIESDLPAATGSLCPSP
jgi:ribonuclease J